MDLGLKQIRAFVTVADLRSFTRAAERLHITQPSLSTQIHQLERHIGFRLFDRSTRHVVLTQEGETLLPVAQKLVGQSDNFQNIAASLRGELSRRVRLGAAIYTSDIPERRALIDTFGEAYRDIDVIIDGASQQMLVAELIAHELDLALVIGAPMDRASYQAGERGEILYPDDLCRLMLRRERIGLRLPLNDPLADKAEIRTTDFEGRTIAVPTLVHGARLIAPIIAAFEAAGATCIFPPDPSATGVERYGFRNGIAAVTLGWFDQPAEEAAMTVRRTLADLESETCLALLASPDVEGAAARFLNFATRFAGR